ncbi:MAG: YbaB/EbfC family nucleoid-associated protein [Cyclobacteriaceae bacterium]|nr:YbaB/EbfC family nucleoid-associated protein [Cyclobacteriaceae bacterium]MCK5703716.1 YbaB/EbfC family nucleoid-associated protein [Cyclobacteriaceae bacterium]
MMDMSNMFGKMREMQSKLKEVQENLDNITAEGESGGGMVKVIVNGRKKIISVNIEESLLTPQDKEMVQDLVVAAVNNAIANVELKSNEEIKKTTEGMMPNIPGLDFSKMF